MDAGQARSLGILVGDEVLLVSGRTRLSPLGPVPITATVAVSGVGGSPVGRRAPELQIALSQARRLFAMPEDRATALEVRLSEPARAKAVAEELRQKIGASFAITSWEEANRALVLALRLERFVLFATVSLIVIVAGLNLAATSAVLAATRATDAVVLAVLGAPPKAVASIFVATGAAIGFLGTVSGTAFGAGLAVLLDRTSAIPLPTRLYGLSHVPFRLEWFDVVAVLLLSCVWSLLAASLPSRAVARLNLSETLRAV